MTTKKLVIYATLSLAFLLFGTFLINDALKYEDICVYVTNTGDCYHNRHCYYLKSIKKMMPLQEAEKSYRYRSCSYCSPDKKDKAIFNKYGLSFLITFLVYIIFLFIIYLVNNRKN